MLPNKLSDQQTNFSDQGGKGRFWLERVGLGRNWPESGRIRSESGRNVVG